MLFKALEQKVFAACPGTQQRIELTKPVSQQKEGWSNHCLILLTLFCTSLCTLCSAWSNDLSIAVTFTLTCIGKRVEAARLRLSVDFPAGMKQGSASSTLWECD